MKQRKNLGVEKALENSDSEMDEPLERQVDQMIDARQKAEDREAKEKRQRSILAMRKVLNRQSSSAN